MGYKLIQIHSCAYPEHYSNYFTEYVEQISNTRKTGPFEKKVGKLLVNALYGRFGLRPGGDIYEFKKKPSTDYKESQVYDVNGIKIYRRSLLEDKANLSTISNVSISSCIASKARCRLYRGYITVKKSGGRILYSDTDSLFAAYPRNVDILDVDLGDSIIFDSNLDDTEIIDSRFCAAKSYALVYKSGVSIAKIKGVKKGEISFEEVKRSFDNDQMITTKVTQWEKKDFEFKQKDVFKKTRLHQYNKRIFSNNKKYTKPLIH